MNLKRLQHTLSAQVKRSVAIGLAGFVLMGALIPGTYGTTLGQSQSTVPINSQTAMSQEVRGIWISYFELEVMLKNKSESDFRSAYEAMINNLVRDGFNTVYVQVRPFSDALYLSPSVPSSYMMTGVEGSKMNYDPMKIMIELTHAKQLKFEAWLNPYRVRIPYVKASISKANIASKWLNDKSNRVVKLSTGTFFNPSDPSVNAMFVKEVTYIVENYKVDGIHLDDYFYPTTASSFDKPQYDAYLKAGGKLKLADFRRHRINEMVKAVYQACKSGSNPVKFGISPQGIQKNNYDGQFADVAKWATESGYVDYICPQIYYGYQNQTAPFKSILSQWDSLAQRSKVDFYIGLAPYKIGLTDKYAHTGSAEWQTSKGIMKQMVTDSRLMTGYKGVVFFRYDSLYKPSKAVAAAIKAEKELMVELWQDVLAARQSY